MHGPEAILPGEATVDHTMLQKRLAALQEARQEIMLDLIRDRLTTKAQAMPQLASLNESLAHVGDKYQHEHGHHREANPDCGPHDTGR